MKFQCFHRGANLTIVRVKKEDRGRYICEASNGIGNKVSKTVVLEVSFGPSISVTRPRVGQKEDYTAKLICRSTSYPPAAMSFQHKNKELSSNEHYQIAIVGIGNGETEAILTINHVKKHHYGEYLCVAKNQISTAESKLELFGKEVINFNFLFYFIPFSHLFLYFFLSLLFVSIRLIFLF